MSEILCSELSHSAIEINKKIECVAAIGRARNLKPGNDIGKIIL